MWLSKDQHFLTKTDESLMIRLDLKDNYIGLLGILQSFTTHATVVSHSITAAFTALYYTRTYKPHMESPQAVSKRIFFCFQISQ